MPVLLSLLLLFVAADRRDPEITALQNHIARFDTHGYYAAVYRQTEHFCWSHLPGWMREDAAKRRVESVLDAGCGYGTLLAFAAKTYGAKGYCIDVNDYLWPEIASAYGLSFHRGNLELSEIPWSHQKFQVVILTEVLEHFNFNPLPTLCKLRDAMAPDGVLFLSTPDAGDWGRTHRYYRRFSDLPMPTPGTPHINGHIWIYNKKELLTVLKQAGFAVVRLAYAPGGGNRHFNVMARVSESK